MKIKLLDDHAKAPTKAHDTDSGYDFYALEDVVVKADGVTKVATGVALQLPPHIWMKIEAKSGRAIKNNLGVTAGVIDNEYRGPIVLAVVNYGSDFQMIKRGEKVAQGVLMPLVICGSEVVKEFDGDTERGENGFGSTGLT